MLDRLSGGAIVEALGDVPPKFREVVVLVDIGEFSYQDAADILGVPIGTVMSRLHRGRRALKQALAAAASGGRGMSLDPCVGRGEPAPALPRPAADRVAR